MARTSLTAVASTAVLCSGLLYVVWWLSKDFATEDRRLSGIVFGHSFVSRFGEDLNEIRGDEQRSNQDLLQVNDRVDSLEVIGLGGARLDYFENFCDKLKKESLWEIDFLVVDLGSNDLGEKTNPKELVERMVQLGHELVEKRLVLSIVFLQVTARAHSHNDKFAEDRQIFNDNLVKLVRNESGLRYQEMTPYSEEKIKEWSDDGIHATSKMGREMYFHTIQQAIAAAVEACSVPRSSPA